MVCGGDGCEIAADGLGVCPGRAGRPVCNADGRAGPQADADAKRRRLRSADARGSRPLHDESREAQRPNRLGRSATATAKCFANSSTPTATTSSIAGAISKTASRSIATSIRNSPAKRPTSLAEHGRHPLGRFARRRLADRILENDLGRRSVGRSGGGPARPRSGAIQSAAAHAGRVEFARA